MSRGPDFLHDDGMPCTSGWGNDDGTTDWHCPGCCPEDCPGCKVECDTCHALVPRDEVTHHTQSATYECIICIEKQAAYWLNQFGGPAIVRQTLANEKFYRDDGLLGPDGRYDLDALRRLK